MPETLLTIEQVAEQLRVSTRTVRRIMDTDEIKGFRVGKRWRFTQSEIDAYVKRKQDEDTDKRPAIKPAA
jgi:excisionase family DNA binding protein